MLKKIDDVREMNVIDQMNLHPGSLVKGALSSAPFLLWNQQSFFLFPPYHLGDQTLQTVTTWRPSWGGSERDKRQQISAQDAFLRAVMGHIPLRVPCSHPALSSCHRNAHPSLRVLGFLFALPASDLVMLKLRGTLWFFHTPSTFL